MLKTADWDHLISLFTGPLVGVRFPDIDAEVLTTQATAVEEAEARVEAVRRELDDARRVLDEEQTKLACRVDRALAYLRVYADGNPALLGEIEAISHRPQSATQLPPRRRGRPPKVSGALLLEQVARAETAADGA